MDDIGRLGQVMLGLLVNPKRKAVNEKGALDKIQDSIVVADGFAFFIDSTAFKISFSR